MRFGTIVFFILVYVAGVHGEIPLVGYKSMEIPVTPFSNMASGYQATNPGFRVILKTSNGEFIAGGDLTMDAVMAGYSGDASQGTAYGKLVLKMNMLETSHILAVMEGKLRGMLSICMAANPESEMRDTECLNLSGNLHEERPFQWLSKEVEFTVVNGQVNILRYFGKTGEGGTSEQISLSVFHPAFGFAAPGKAFKDYQSPLVLDLDHNGQLDLINVWNEAKPVRFDLNGSREKVRTGWVQPQDGLLFVDRGTGCADSGTQFFGEFTRSIDGKRTFANGFEALAKVIQGQSEMLHVAKFPHLKIWRDRNSNGVCEPGEVVGASRLVKSISLRYDVVEKPVLIEDNEIRLVGHYVGRDGKKHLLGDVWFKQRRHDVALSH